MENKFTHPPLPSRFTLKQKVGGCSIFIPFHGGFRRLVKNEDNTQDKTTAGKMENKCTPCFPPMLIFIETESGVGVAFSLHFTKAKDFSKMKTILSKPKKPTAARMENK